MFTDVHRYYSATIIRMSGVKSDEAAIWLSAVTAAVNFLFTMVGLYLVERIGRRPLTLGSLMGQAQFFLWSSHSHHSLQEHWTGRGGRGEGERMRGGGAGGQRYRNRQSDRQTETDRQTDRQRQTETEREKGERESDRERQTETDR